MAGCSKEPTPEERMTQYIKDWNEQNFSSMYEQLSKKTKESISEKDFKERYENIYQAIETEKLKVTFNKPEGETEIKDGETAKLPFSLSMETVAGPVEFEHEASLIQEETEEGKEWFIEWDPSYIFPQLKEGEEVRVTSSSPERGQLFDRNGEGLAINQTVYEIGVIPQGIAENKEEIIDKITKLLPISKEKIDQALAADWVREGDFVPIAKMNPADEETYQQLIELPGIQKKDVTARFYPFGESAAHLVGYVRPITAEQLEEQKDAGYSGNSMIGTRGLEQVYEKELRGESGWKIFIPDSEEVIAEKPAVNGRDIRLTIDATLQVQLTNELKKDEGTAVAIHPKTGETLAMVSTPTYNPNNFLFGWPEEELKTFNDEKLATSIAKFNKLYSPGSTFKPLTAAVGLETGKVDPNKEESITGATWSKEGWGDYEVTRVSTRLEKVNLKDALVTSDNIYFARAALSIGSKTFQSELEKRFALSEELDFYPFPIETSSVSNNGIGSEGLLADSGFGQGEVLMSPLHVAASYTPFLNEGNMIQPYLEMKDSNKPTVWKEGVLSQENANLILSHLKAVVNDPSGTANKPVVEGLELAGKTGTAELKVSKDAKGQENGWFVAMNTNDPRLLVAMMIEDVKDREGSHYVVPKVKNVMKAYLQ
ncbi:penicillin-binding transpeptidase domain-containing protein [Bacillus sp. IB182487]|uniref:serine-type D-Ala-D-Ala carboxypeptidase n=2 Tax=Metabacillus arenae TaxID=2771434 RepID=A0A926S0T6_9BACI|nr:penicillin-binding transpeptidase domain-containing protein [Metabacillus arenae]